MIPAMLGEIASLSTATASDVDRNVGLSSVGFGGGPSSELVVRDQGGNCWVKEDGLGDFFLATLRLDFDGGFG